MSKVQTPKSKVEETVSEELSFVDGELLENSIDEEFVTQVKIMTYEKLPEERKKYMATLRNESYIKINDTYRPMVAPILFVDDRKTEAKKPTK